MSDGFVNNEGRWLWVPAFAGTTEKAVLHRTLTRDNIPLDHAAALR